MYALFYIITSQPPLWRYYTRLLIRNTLPHIIIFNIYIYIYLSVYHMLRTMGTIRGEVRNRIYLIRNNASNWGQEEFCGNKRGIRIMLLVCGYYVCGVCTPICIYIKYIIYIMHSHKQGLFPSPSLYWRYDSRNTLRSVT